MPEALNIACSLSTSDLEGRLAEMAAVGRHALIDSRVDGTHARLRFAAGAGVRERVDAIAAAESDCCAFLTMRVSAEPDAVLLSVDAPAGAEPTLYELVDAFSGDESPR